MPESNVSSFDELDRAIFPPARDIGGARLSSSARAAYETALQDDHQKPAGQRMHRLQCFVPKTPEFWLSTLSVLAGLLLWELMAGFFFPKLILPPPSAVVASLLRPGVAAALLGALSGSLVQLAVGFGLALGCAVPLGMAIGRSRMLTQMFGPVITAFYAIPPVSFVPFLIIWFGLFFEARVALVFLMCVFDMLVIIIAGARDMSPAMLDVGRSFSASRSQQLRLIVFPALTPFLFAALRVGSARAINGMITAELFFAAANLGGILKRASENFDTARAIAVVTVICVLGLVVQYALNQLESRAAHWSVRADR